MSFLNSASLLQRRCSTCLACLNTLTPRETEKDQSPEYFKIFRKNTIFNVHPVCLCVRPLVAKWCCRGRARMRCWRATSTSTRRPTPPSSTKRLSGKLPGRMSGRLSGREADELLVFQTMELHTIT